MRDLFRVEIDTSALRHNISQFQNLLQGKTKLMCVVKANAYGHGLLETAKIAEKNGVSWLAVVNLEEALELRREGIGCNILVIGYTPFERLLEASQQNISVAIYNFDELLRYSGKRLRVHFKVDTGLARMGEWDHDVIASIEKLETNKDVVLEGVWSHFADAENPASYHTNTQIERFLKLKEVCESHLTNTPFFHLGASAASLLFADSRLDMVRVGISTYGFWASEETYESAEELGITRQISLKPVLSYKTQLVQIKNLPPGTLVGYGCTFRVRKASKLGVIPVGYAEGLPRLLSNNGYMLVHGKKCPIIGNVCMNMIMLDITALENPAIGDEVVIIGTQGEVVITANDHAKWTNTINYEVTTRIPPRVKRVYVG